jgi:hypothetical protein
MESRTGFRNVVFYQKLDDDQSPKKNIKLSVVIYHPQSPIDLKHCLRTGWEEHGRSAENRVLREMLGPLQGGSNRTLEDVT